MMTRLSESSHVDPLLLFVEPFDRLSKEELGVESSVVPHGGGGMARLGPQVHN